MDFSQLDPNLLLLVIGGGVLVLLAALSLLHTMLRTVRLIIWLAVLAGIIFGGALAARELQRDPQRITPVLVIIGLGFALLVGLRILFAVLRAGSRQPQRRTRQQPPPQPSIRQAPYYAPSATQPPPTNPPPYYPPPYYPPQPQQPPQPPDDAPRR